MSAITWLVTLGVDGEDQLPALLRQRDVDRVEECSHSGLRLIRAINMLPNRPVLFITAVNPCADPFDEQTRGDPCGQQEKNSIGCDANPDDAGKLWTAVMNERSHVHAESRAEEDRAGPQEDLWRPGSRAQHRRPCSRRSDHDPGGRTPMGRPTAGARLSPEAVVECRAVDSGVHPQLRH